MCAWQAFAEEDTSLRLPDPKFSPGNDDSWKNAGFDDSSWKTIKADVHWENQGYRNLDGYAWYRFRFVLPSSFREKTFSQDKMNVYLARIDDADEAYWNGVKIGKTGRFYDDQGGYSTNFNAERNYQVDANAPFVKWDQENVIAVKVLDDNGLGGMNGAKPVIRMVDKVLIDVSKDADISNPELTGKTVILSNGFSETMSGSMIATVVDRLTGKVLETKKEKTQITSGATHPFKYQFKHERGQMLEVRYQFTDEKTGKKTGAVVESLPYILTPVSPETPRVNGADVFGVRPGSPFLYKIPATGKKPLEYSVENLPRGLQVNNATGIITGKLEKAGNYTVTLVVKNALGTDRKPFEIKCGDLLALTPPMGWNSWNCFGVNVTEEKVRGSAQAMIDKGLIDHGWAYMNIDDGWQAAERDENNILQPNEKFGNIRKLADWMHERGLKLGIYSSPGPLTCGRFLGSYKYETLDADIYNDWGIDYLKYDWCGYSSVVENDSLEAFIKPYRVMEKALRKQPRDIIYSLCQYGMKDVWTWGAQVDANTWRVTGDIEDTWDSLSGIAFRHGVDRMAPYAKPGRWNDLDMMIVGYVGWNDNLRRTRLTWDEQYMHVSFWAIQVTPLLIGCDMTKLDDFTVALLTNDEVIAINQDKLGEQAHRVAKEDGYEVWVKPLHDGAVAVGIFNLDNEFSRIKVRAEDAGVNPNNKVRDVWRQQDTGVFGNVYEAVVPPHGAVLIKVQK